MLSCGVRKSEWWEWVPEMKKPLTTAPVVVPQKRDEACVNGFKFVDHYDNGSIISTTFWIVSTHFNACQHRDLEYLFWESGFTLAG